MSNIVGDIYGTVKDGKSSIILNSNTIDISGTLTTHGHIQLFQSNHEITGTPDPSGIINRFNTVINIPTTDSDGNALTANTTYEMTTGPAGNINNISFVKKLPDYVLSAYKDNEFTSINNDTDTSINDWVVAAQKNTSFTVGTVFNQWTCPANGLYHIVVEGVFYNSYVGGQHRELYHATLKINVTDTNNNTSTVKESLIDIGSTETADDLTGTSLICSTIRNMSANETVSFAARTKTHTSVSTEFQGIKPDGTQYSVVHIIRVG